VIILDFINSVEEEGKSVYHNMIQYKLTDYFGDVVRCDYSQKNLWVPRPLFDAIVTDRMMRVVVRIVVLIIIVVIGIVGVGVFVFVVAGVVVIIK
jgi:hypothetical protein